MQFFADLPKYAFLQYALVTGVLAAVASGVVGTYVVTRRVTSIAGAISHSVLGGLGAAAYAQKALSWSWMHPLYGAGVVAVGSALVIGVLNLRAREREDTVIGAIWAIGMAIGVLFLARTPGYNQDLMSYLFGNILLVSDRDLWMVAALDGVVVLVAGAFYHQLLAVCFDEEFARLRGLNVEFYYLMLLVLTALTVVLLVTVVGIVMVIAMLTLPIAIAERLVHRVSHVMVVSVALTIAFTVAGLAVSYDADLPSGATIIMIAGGAYLLAMVLGRRKRAA